MELKELLEKAGVKDVEKILADMKANKLFITGEEGLDGKYGTLKTEHEAQTKELTEAKALIETLKKSGAGDDTLQKKITEYEEKVKTLQAELEAAKLDSALKVALLEAKATDVDYLMYKLGKDGLELGTDGKIKDIDSKIEALKKAHPNQFEAAGKTKVKETKLPEDPKNHEGEVTKEQFDKMSYQQKAELYTNDPETYKTLSGKAE